MLNSRTLLCTVSLLLALSLCLLRYQSGHAATAALNPPQNVGQTRLLQPAPPLPTEESASPVVHPAPERPVPPIVARVIAPTPAKPLVRARMQLAPTWEAPVGPASTWQDKETYLFLGTDRRQGSSDWRTDVVMVVGFDRAAGQAVVFSIPRDLYVNIPGYGMGRINQADFIGERNPQRYGSGPALVSTIISQTLGIEPEHWVRFQMDGFVRIVDAVGGVNIYLDCPFAEPIFNLTTNSWDYFTLPAGDNWLDGDSAYWFVRLRLHSSDIERAQRQRQFLWALRDQMLNTNLIGRFPELWGAFSDSFATDLTLVELIDLTRLGLSFNAENVRAGGLTLADLYDFRTAEGAAVLGIGDPGRVRAVVNGVWAAQPMANSNRQTTTQCEPLPQGLPQLDHVVTVETFAAEGTVPRPGEQEQPTAPGE